MKFKDLANLAVFRLRGGGTTFLKRGDGCRRATTGIWAGLVDPDAEVLPEPTRSANTEKELTMTPLTHAEKQDVASKLGLTVDQMSDIIREAVKKSPGQSANRKPSPVVPITLETLIYALWQMSPDDRVQLCYELSQALGDAEFINDPDALFTQLTEMTVDIDDPYNLEDIEEMVLAFREAEQEHKNA